MQGKLGGDKTAKQADVNITPALKKEIEELELRRNNLKNEIEKAVSEARAEVAIEYQEKERSLEVTYQSKLADLEGKNKSLVVWENELRNKDAEIIRKTEELKGLSVELEKVKADTIAMTETLANKSKEAIAALSDDKIKIQEGYNIIATRTAELNAKDNELNNLSFELSDKKNKLVELEKSLLANQAGIDKANEDLDVRENNINSLAQQNNALSLELENKRQAVELELKGATEAHARAEQEEQVTLTEILKVKETNDNLSKNLQILQESLAEKEKSLKERERINVLKEREIDNKIATLKKLREGVA